MSAEASSTEIASAVHACGRVLLASYFGNDQWTEYRQTLVVVDAVDMLQKCG